MERCSPSLCGYLETSPARPSLTNTFLPPSTCLSSTGPPNHQPTASSLLPPVPPQLLCFPLSPFPCLLPHRFTQPLRVFGDLPCQNANTMAIFSPDEQLVLTGVTTGNSTDEMGALVIYDRAEGEVGWGGEMQQ